MKRNFYRNLFDILNLNGEAFVVTVIKGAYNGSSVIGQKLLKSKEKIFIENENIKDFWDRNLSNVDFTKGTYILALENEIELFIEHIIGQLDLVICGGGHIALPLCKMAKMIGFNITIIDDREGFVNKNRFPMADNILCKNFDEAFREIKFNRNIYFVLVTKGHKDDKKCLEIILKNDFHYVGMLGSKGKIAYVINSMLENGYTKEDVDKVHTPIGLEIGANTPAEIAISILGEIIKVKNESPIINIENDIFDGILERDEPKILATIIEKHGSGPRGVGTKMLINKNKSFIGTVGGGKVENAVYEKALELIESKKSILKQYDLSNSVSAKLGMACGGSIKVLFEFIE
ncbi:xanthine dehydrogenase accessory factor [Clostridium cavendishii DSM 21758]|uniref:Xanthine dehydrogenase accessory factor n=1 Tax=Clostridium cavendishii DSM 21758 TaxID=1121302 RepID=A0A1M6DJE4_9CLOT|nr:XdhC/CoxI family protein [Clostridium cavendishii]SHI73251.1 xanthine dehydrogenase accessory factor [Clostridium cavendishii DSM 21758]